MTLLEVDEAANAISGQVDPEANIIFGAAFDPQLDGVVRVSVVATGMDGASIAAIEPKRFEAVAEAPMDIILEPANATTEDAPEPVMAAAFAAAPAAPVTEDQSGFTFEETKAEVLTLQTTRATEPVAEADEEPLFPSRQYGEDRRQKGGGWLSLFGSRRPDAQPAPARTMAQAQPAPEAFEDEETAEDEDLEIPSFLRRLAN
jgi:cell division protein FtsZ